MADEKQNKIIKVSGASFKTIIWISKIAFPGQERKRCIKYLKVFPFTDHSSKIICNSLVIVEHFSASQRNTGEKSEGHKHVYVLL